MRLILLGPPGAGKGTQAAKIEKKFNLSHVSTGDIFRNNIKEKTELGKKVEGILKKGGLVSDDITIDLVKLQEWIFIGWISKKSSSSKGFRWIP